MAEPEKQRVQSTQSNVLDDTRAVLARILVQHKLISTDDILRCERIAQKLDSGTTFYQLLQKLKIVDESQVLDALRDHGFSLPFGAMLVELGYIREVDLRQMLMVQQEDENRLKLGEIILERQMMKENDILRVLSSHMGLTWEEPDLPDCEQKYLSKTPLKTMDKLEFFPVRSDNEKVVVAFTDPLDQRARTEAASLYSTEIRPVLTSKSALKRIITLLVQHKKGVSSKLKNNMHQAGAPAQVYHILQAAIALGASDIHMEPMQDRVRVRNRIDGVLREYSEIPVTDYPGMVSCIKIEAGADIAERRRHQDGRIHFVDRTTAQETDLRVSIYNTIHGECVVLRVLSRSETLPRR